MAIYDVALSFAGEQRDLVEAIAKCLKEEHQVSVFYDKYEKAALWGKDLYEHLSDVYQNQARFCIMFVSKEYAEKVWTTHERKSAQARAFRERGNEYILPVKFDDTDIPGLPSTTGYLNFADEGVSGVCQTILDKLGRAPVIQFQPAAIPLTCDFSSRLYLNTNDGQTAFPVVLEALWGDSEISLLTEDDSGTSFFGTLKNANREITLAYGFDVALTRLTSATRELTSSGRRWRLKFKIARHQFGSYMEASMNGTSPDQFADMRARRILLNEFPVGELNTSDLRSLAENSMWEIGIRGSDEYVRIEKSRLPILYSTLHDNGQDFLNVAWIVSIADLKLSATVESIEKLTFTLAESALHVDFAGLRRKSYANEPATRIEVQGDFDLGL